MVSDRPAVLSPAAAVAGGDRPQDRPAGPCRHRADAPLFELRERALDGTRRKPTRRFDPLHRAWRFTGAIRFGRLAESDAGPRVPPATARRKAAGRRTDPHPPPPRSPPRRQADSEEDMNTSTFNVRHSSFLPVVVPRAGLGTVARRSTAGWRLGRTRSPRGDAVW